MTKSFILKSWILLLIGSCISNVAVAQESNLGNWLIVFGNKQINEKVNWHHEVQYRNYDAIGDLEQLLIRTGIGYNIAPQTNLLGGYGFIRSENYNQNSNEKSVINEHRIYQQLILKNKINKIKLQHRYRFEQRMIEGPGDGDIKLRFRYFLNAVVPIVNLDDNRSLYLSTYNEIFINTSNVIFDRNRLYGGIGYKLNDRIKLELGYMNQFFTSSGRDQINVIGFINW